MSLSPHKDGFYLSKSQVAKLLKRAKAGENSSVLADHFGISRRMVNYYRKEAGVSGQRGGPAEKYKYKGETHTLREWALKLDVPYSCLRGRLDTGWTVEETFTQPHGIRRKHTRPKPMLSDEQIVQILLEQAAGVSLEKLAKKHGMSLQGLHRRMRDIRGAVKNYEWKTGDPRKPHTELWKSVQAFLKKKRLLTEFRVFHLTRIQ